jgi:integrase
VLKQEIGWLDRVERAKKPAKLPVVLSRDEVRRLLGQLSGTARLMASLLYGSGLRLMECVRLRVKDIDFAYAQITVRDAKGGKDRVTMLPVELVDPLQKHLARTKAQHDQDLDDGHGSVFLPFALERKFPNAQRQWIWQYVFASSRLATDPRTGKRQRHHIAEGMLQNAVKEAAQERINQAGKLPQFTAFVRHSSPRERVRHPNRAGITWAPRHPDNDDLYTCAQQAGPGGEEPVGLRSEVRERGISYPHRASRPASTTAGS